MTEARKNAAEYKHAIELFLTSSKRKHTIRTFNDEVGLPADFSSLCNHSIVQTKVVNTMLAAVLYPHAPCRLFRHRGGGIVSLRDACTVPTFAETIVSHKPIRVSGMKEVTRMHAFALAIAQITLGDINIKEIVEKAQTNARAKATTVQQKQLFLPTVASEGKNNLFGCTRATIAQMYGCTEAYVKKYIDQRKVKQVRYDGVRSTASEASVWRQLILDSAKKLTLDNIGLIDFRYTKELTSHILKGNEVDAEAQWDPRKFMWLLVFDYDFTDTSQNMFLAENKLLLRFYRTRLRAYARSEFFENTLRGQKQLFLLQRLSNYTKNKKEIETWGRDFGELYRRANSDDFAEFDKNAGECYAYYLSEDYEPWFEKALGAVYTELTTNSIVFYDTHREQFILVAKTPHDESDIYDTTTDLVSWASVFHKRCHTTVYDTWIQSDDNRIEMWEKKEPHAIWAPKKLTGHETEWAEAYTIGTWPTAWDNRKLINMNVQSTTATTATFA